MQRSDGKPVVPLTKEHAKAVADKISAWPTNRRLTWDDVVALATIRIKGKPYSWTRQTLDRNPHIKDAYVKKQESIRNVASGKAVPRPKSKPVEELEAKIARLEETLKARSELLAIYDQRLIKYLHNANLHGVTEAMLEAPMAPPDRGQTDRDELAKVRAKAAAKRGR